MEAFLDSLNSEQEEIYEALKALILDQDSAIVERSSYGIPFYFRKKRLFHINLEKAKKQMYLGFCMGAKLDPENFFLEGDGTSIRKKSVQNLSAAKDPDLKALVIAAIELDV